MGCSRVGDCAESNFVGEGLACAGICVEDEHSGEWVGKLLDSGGLLEDCAHTAGVYATSGDAVSISPGDSLRCGAVERVSEEEYALVDVGLHVQAGVCVEEHARAAIAETVTVKRGHESGQGVRGLPRDVARVVRWLPAVCDGLELQVWCENGCGPEVRRAFDVVELALLSGSGEKILPEIARSVCEPSEARCINSDCVSEDAVDEVEVAVDVFVLPVELHGDVLKDVEELACREQGLEVSEDPHKLEEKA